jgi:ABC-type multidrug transport system ATPase subunit
MGPSGSGKTTLFRVLSGRAPTGRNIEHKGDLRYGNSKIESLPGGMEAFRKRIAYVPQFDVLPEASTPREALRFSARLRLPAATTNEEIEDLVNDYITNLGLTKCADTVIGSDVGISGGERKRTNIGIELVTNPGIIFCDEVSMVDFSCQILLQ